MAEPAINFGTSSKFGSQTGWSAQAPSVNVVSQRKVAPGPTGNAVASKVFDERTDVTQDFVSASATVAPTIPAIIGKLFGDYILTGISISTVWNDFVKMALAGHNHSANAHADTLQQGAHSQTLSVAFGAQDFLGGTAGDAASIESSTWNCTCDHKDDNALAGDHVVGNNHNGHITATSTWIGVPTTPAGSGWDKVSAVTTEAPDGHLRTVVTAEKDVALAAS